ncbi:MAG: cytidylate kinase-like family protein [Verrucomicrobia bacterium]|nr:cytidylate kinase-like family protein [Verrucomicrobiota bacterium]
MRRNSLDVFARYLSAQAPQEKAPSIPKPAITISRETGAGAVTVAYLVAQQLDKDCPGEPPCPWAIFDRNLASEILKDHNLSAKVERFMPEDSKFPLTDVLESLLGLHPINWTLKEYAKETIRKLVMKGNVIVVGRGAGIVTARLPRVLHVRLVAPYHFRVQHFAEFYRVTNEEANHLVRERDEARRRYVQSYYNADVHDLSHYHLVINTARNGFEGAAEIISNALVNRITRFGPKEEHVISA